MKILATKKEMVAMVRFCATEGLCASCVLGDFCCKDGVDFAVEDFIEIVEASDEETEEKQTPL